MKTIRVIQIGMGPLGRKICGFITQRKLFKLVGAVDKDPNLLGQDVGELFGSAKLGVKIVESLSKGIRNESPDIAILTTVSEVPKVVPQIEEILSLRIPVITTCEELSYPWKKYPDLSESLDRMAKKSKVAVLSTGVNPGFLMDTLPVTLTAVCQRVDAVRVYRVQNASFRRIAFQKKIGVGLTPTQFNDKVKEGTLRHVGLIESMHLIGARIGWILDKTEDVITPIVAQRRIVAEAMTIQAGIVAGVQQIGRGFAGGVERITLTFRASIGEPDPEDRVEIRGEPLIVSSIKGGINGDIATCAIVLNVAPLVLAAQPGLKTMMDIPPVSYNAG
jgi:4-hydroxy-tetrahydrodipicolinate reductase